MKRLLFLALIALAGCTATGAPVVPLPTVPNISLDPQTTFKQACALVSTANGSFLAVAPALEVQGKLTADQVKQEQAIFTLASTRCDHPPVNADGSINYMQLALDTAADAASISLLFAGPSAPAAAARVVRH